MTDYGRVNLDWALALLEGLVGAGLQEVVISPGSRSTPLALAALLQPQVRQTVILDERCAAFTALGMARASGRAVALVATSGSAPGNWLPAVMEADEAGVPLILLSADRPWELQQCGANQTTDQLALFGGHVRAFHALSEAVEDEAPRGRLRDLGRQVMFQARWPDPGPVHLNCRFREPLVPASVPSRPRPVEVRPPRPPLQAPPPDLVAHVAGVMQKGAGLILAGEGATTDVLALADTLRLPVLADPLSGLRFSGWSSVWLVTDYHMRLAGAGDPPLPPRWTLQFGALPLSAHLRAALERWPLENWWVVNPRGRRIDPLGAGVELLPFHLSPLCDALMTALEGKALQGAVLQDAPDVGMPPEARLARTLFDALPDGSLLFSGNSLAIRWIDAWSGSDERKIAIHGNRGLSGIDGNLSTFIGMARCWPGSGRKVALVGDLTFQHDLGALANTQGLDAVVVVVNNGGGGIFERLPQRRLPGFDALWRTPQPLDLSGLPGLFGTGFMRVESLERFAATLEAATHCGGFQVVEVMLPGQRV